MKFGVHTCSLVSNFSILGLLHISAIGNAMPSHFVHT